MRWLIALAIAGWLWISVGEQLPTATSTATEVIGDPPAEAPPATAAPMETEPAVIMPGDTVQPLVAVFDPNDGAISITECNLILGAHLGGAPGDCPTHLQMGTIACWVAPSAGSATEVFAQARPQDWAGDEAARVTAVAMRVMCDGHAERLDIGVPLLDM